MQELVEVYVILNWGIFGRDVEATCVDQSFLFRLFQILHLLTFKIFVYKIIIVNSDLSLGIRSILICEIDN